jgi:hypothetical protein
VPSSPASSSSSSSSSVPSSPLRTSDLSNRRRSMWFESGSSLDYGSNSAKSSGCYASLVKVLLRSC